MTAVRVTVGVTRGHEDQGTGGVDDDTEGGGAHVEPAGVDGLWLDELEDRFEAGVETQSEQEDCVDKATEDFGSSPAEAHIEGTGALGGLVSPVGNAKRDDIAEVVKAVGHQSERAEPATDSEF